MYFDAQQLTFLYIMSREAVEPLDATLQYPLHTWKIQKFEHLVKSR